MLSTNFAYLPNGIIREIIAYTGAKYKKRNGKYMGQIPKNDPRFTLLRNIPKKHTEFIHVNDEYTYSSSKVVLLKNDRYDIYTIELHVIGVIYKNNQSKFAWVNSPIYTTRFIVDDGNNNRRQYSYCEEKISTNINKWIVIVDRLWWISFGYLSISVIMALRNKFSQK